VAFPVTSVREVLNRVGPAAAVFKAESWVHGLINVRSEAVPVFDLAILLCIAECTEEPTHIVIIDDNSLLAGFLASGPVEIEELDRPPSDVPASQSSAPMEAVRQLAEVEGRSVLVLDAGKLLGLPRLQRLRAGVASRER